MKSKKVEFLDEANREFQAAFDWHIERSEQAAARFSQEDSNAISKIAAAPDRWQSGIRGTRRIFLKKFPFAVIYRELPDVVQILAVAHVRRRPGYWKKRL